MFKNLWHKDKGFVVALGLVGCLILSAIGFYFLGTVPMIEPVGTEIVVHRGDNLESMIQVWFKSYMEGYESFLIPVKQQIKGYEVKSYTTLETGDNPVVQIDFTISPRVKNQDLTLAFEGFEEKGEIHCQWVLWLKESVAQEETYIITRVGRRAQYDAEIYYESGEQEKDEYEQEFIEEIPYTQTMYTYKIDNEKCYVSYDGGQMWIEVPIDLETLVKVSDGHSSYNKLQEGSYLISPNKTAFVFGGAYNAEEKGFSPLKLIYSNDQGQSWQTSVISSEVSGVRVKFISFPTSSVGYVVAAFGRTMSQEAQAIFKTVDGGITWEYFGSTPRTSLLQAAGFITETIGFFTYPVVEGADTNFYRTDNGYIYSEINLPVIEVDGLTPFVQPEIPYFENDELYVLVGQGGPHPAEQEYSTDGVIIGGDYKGGRLMAKFKSNDLGMTWEFVEYVEPPVTEIG